MFEDPTPAAVREPAWVCGRHGVSLLGCVANTQYGMHVGLGQPAEVPTQTIERVEKALTTLQSIERFACDQHDHFSFAKASSMPWILVSGWSHQQ